MGLAVMGVVWLGFSALLWGWVAGALLFGIPGLSLVALAAWMACLRNSSWILAATGISWIRGFKRGAVAWSDIVRVGRKGATMVIESSQGNGIVTPIPIGEEGMRAFASGMERLAPAEAAVAFSSWK